MNELINNLVEKSGIDTVQDGAGYIYHKAWPEDLEKFAKLIMEECASACSSSRCGREVSAEDLIKMHFGG